MNEQAISLLQQILDQHQKQTSLLEQIATQNLALIEALADEGSVDPDGSPQTYLNGAPCR
ncbi:MAG: hypothetical protein ACOKSU_27010 [Pseudomonas sp.]|uniref:hypothetical protein n=1 Tax=Pseudomonas TaxID=286 RepID=UPI0003C0737D|nr:hypothetical protein [Pseudomonas sp. VLB120]AGZ34617.1 hypothetical protein PVLB_09095 [Pseudomonas sp. VLB120]